MESAIKQNAKKRHLNAEDCGSFGRSPEGTDVLTQTNNLSHRNSNYDPERGHYSRTHSKKLKLEGPDEQQRGIIDFFSVTNVISSSPKKSLQQCTDSQSQGLGREVTPKNELKVEDEEDVGDGVRLLATPLKDEKEIDYLEGMTAEMFGDDDEFERWYDGNGVLTLSHENANQVEREVEQYKVGTDKNNNDVNILGTPLKDEEEIDYLEGMTVEMFQEDDEFDRWCNGDGVLTLSQENTKGVNGEELEQYKVGKDKDDDDYVNLLATPQKDDKEIDYLEGMKVEMFVDYDEFERCNSVLTLSHTNASQVESEELEQYKDKDYVNLPTTPLKDEEEIDYLEGMTAEMFGDDDEFECCNSVLTLSHTNASQVESEELEQYKDKDYVNLPTTPLKDEEEIDYLEGMTTEMFGDNELERCCDDHGDGVLTLSQENASQIEREELEQYEVQQMKEPQDCAKDLTVEVPARDLYHHTAHDIIQEDPTFVPRKKRYDRYLMGEKDTIDAVRTVFEESGILLESNDTQQSVCQLVILMAQHEPGERVRPEDVLQCVRKHNLFPQAEACLMVRFEKIQDSAPNAYAAMALILLLSETVKDVQALVSHLQGTMTHRATTEFLYEMATFLLAMDRNGIWISNRLHYNIYHVLYLMRNSPTQIHANHSGPQIHMTDEQHKILSHDISNNHVVKIIAFAGTGKTSTLVRYAQKWRDRRFLYVAFNRSVATAVCFPNHVVCRTIHSMAFHALDVGRKYKKKLSSNLKALHITQVLPKGRSGFAHAKVVTLTLNAYMASADQCITTSHVPETYKNNKGVIVNLDQEKKREYVMDAQNIWNKMKDPNERRYFMTHDGYLKLWQLEKPCLSEDFDVIFLDEAQDCTPVIMDILLSQRCGKILVGDPHQQIYSFRGAVNALHIVQHTHLYYLTQSFRFGAEIAYIGATILQVCKNVKEILVGGNQPGHFCDKSTDPFVMSVRGKTAILARSNVGVFSEAVRLTDANPCCRIHFVGGIELTLRQILDIWHLMLSGRNTKPIAIKDRFIRSICLQAKGFLGLKMYASETEDHELEAKLALVEKYPTRIPELVERLNRCFESDIRNADFILGTVHKAKGLEFDTVIITDDFDMVPCARHNLRRMNDFSWNRIPEDEWNLLYVAVTRAKTSLIFNKTVCNILTQAGEYFLKPEMISSVTEEGQPPQCSVRECGNFIMTDSAFAMCKRPMRYMDSIDHGGPLCERCVWQRIGPTAFLQTDKIFNQPETQEQLYCRYPSTTHLSTSKMLTSWSTSE